MAKALSSQEFMVEALYMYHGGGQTSIAEGQNLPELSDEQRKLTDPMQVIQALQENARAAAEQHLLNDTKPKFTGMLEHETMEKTYGRIRDVLIEAGYEKTIGRAPVMDKNGKPSREINLALIQYQKEHGMLPTGFLPDGGVDPATQYLLAADRLTQMSGKKGVSINMDTTSIEDKRTFLAEKGVLDPVTGGLAAKPAAYEVRHDRDVPPPVAAVDPRQAGPGELGTSDGMAVVTSDGSHVQLGSGGPAAATPASSGPNPLLSVWKKLTAPRAPATKEPAYTGSTLTTGDGTAVNMGNGDASPPAAQTGTVSMNLSGFTFTPAQIEGTAPAPAAEPPAKPLMSPPAPTAAERMAADAAEMAGRAKTAGGQLAADAQAGLAEAGQQAGRLANQAGAALSGAAEQGRQAVVEGLDKLKGWLAPDKPTAPAAPAAKAAGTPKPRPPADSSAQFD